VEVKNTGGMAGECDLNVTVTDPAGTVIDSAVVPTGTISSLETKSVLIFNDLHIPVTDPPIALPYIVTVSVIDCCTGEEVICEIEVTAPPALHVVDIVQPATLFWCEEALIDVYVHNEGGKAGECEVTVYVVDAMTEEPILPPIVEPVPVTAPCDTTVVQIPIHAEDWWPGMVVIVAMACADDPMDPYICLPPIEVAPPPAVAGVGSEWEYEVTYDPGGTEVTYWTATMAERGLTDPLPDGDCVNSPSGAGPYYHLHIDTNATCDCDAVTCTETSMPYRSTGGILTMVPLTQEIYASEGKLLDHFTLMPSCGVLPAMAAGLSVSEIATAEYTVLSGTMGYPYAVGDKWSSYATGDAYSSTMGCVNNVLPGTVPDSYIITEVKAIGVTNPSGGYSDCVEIWQTTVTQIDNDTDGSFSEDRTADTVDQDADTQDGEDPVETDPATGCTTKIWWSPTTLSMVEKQNPCSYDEAENWLLTSYTPAP